MAIIGPLGQAEAITIANRILTGSTLKSVSAYATNTATTDSSGAAYDAAQYVVPGAKNFKIKGLIFTSGFTCAVATGLRIWYADNSGGNTNPVYFANQSAGKLTVPAGAFGTKTEFALDFVVPTGKYVFIGTLNGSETHGGTATLFGLEEA